MNHIKSIGAVYASLVPMLIGLAWIYNEVIIPDIQNKTKGGLGIELAEALNVERSQVKSELKKMHEIIHDTLPNYIKYIPMIIEQLNTYDVGLKVSKGNMEMTYLAKDGKYYQVVKMDTGQFRGYHYYLYNDGKKYWTW